MAVQPITAPPSIPRSNGKLVGTAVPPANGHSTDLDKVWAEFVSRGGDDHAISIAYTFHKHLHPYIKAAPETLDTIRRNVSDFLREKLDDGGTIDMCILWRLLVVAIETTPSCGCQSMMLNGNAKAIPNGNGTAIHRTDEDVNRTIISSILQIEPFLSFEVLPLKHIEFSCSKNHDQEQDAPPFRYAIQCGLCDVLNIMIEKGKQHLEDENKKDTGFRLRHFNGKQSFEAERDWNAGDTQSWRAEVQKNPTAYLVKILKSEYLGLTALAITVAQFMKKPGKQFHFLRMVEALLGFDYFDGYSGRLAEKPDNSFSKCIKEKTNLFHPILRILLKFRSDLVSEGEIKTAIREQNYDVVDLLLNEAGTKVSADILKVIVESNELRIWRHPSIQAALKRELTRESAKLTAQLLLEVAIEQGHDEIVHQLLPLANAVLSSDDEVESLLPPGSRRVNTPLPSRDLIIESIIRFGRWQIWNLKPVQDLWKEMNPVSETGTKDLKKNTAMLHVAVQCEKVEFVKGLLEGEPAIVGERAAVAGHDELVYALWHNNFEKVEQGVPIKRKTKSELRTSIRDHLVHAAIVNVEKLDELGRIFRSSNERVKQYCFDASHFTSNVFNFTQFVASLLDITNHSKMSMLGTDKHLNFEPVIRYAEFPALDPRTSGWDRAGDVHKEIFDVLTWLGSKGVKKIVKLKVLDRMFSPHDEMEIANQVALFEVEILDWRCLDLAISLFKLEETRKRLKELHLYSSGKMAAIDHWLGENGVKSLNKDDTVKVYIHLVQDLVPLKRQKILKKFINTKLEIIQPEFPKLSLVVDVRAWNSVGVGEEKNLDDIAERAVPSLHPFIGRYQSDITNRKHDKLPFRPTKIAILDNGILNIPPIVSSDSEEEQLARTGLWRRIEGGESFVAEESRMASWLFASHPHGTQMANLICAIDPHCEILVGKITEGKYGITLGRVTEAIKWAARQDVDIISMSFSIPCKYDDEWYTKDIDKLNIAVRDAYSKGIILFCSSHDEGHNIDEAYPEHCQETVTIASCNRFGEFTDRKPPDYAYKICGTDILAGVVPYLDSTDSISGSSVATAIVAGLSSLILSCHYNNGSGSEDDKKKNWTTVDNALKKMVNSNSDRYLQLNRFGYTGVKETGKADTPEYRAVPA